MTSIFDSRTEPASVPLTLSRRNLLALALANTALAACGGGGGDSAQASATPSLTLLAGQAGGPGNVDGQGSAARFQKLFGVVADADGTAYVTDSWNHAIRKVTSTGQVTTVAGRSDPAAGGHVDGIGTAAAFDNPGSIAIGADGALFVGDLGNSTIRRVDKAGRVSTVAGQAYVEGSADGDAATARLGRPYALCQGPDGIYFTDLSYADSSWALRRLGPDGIVQTIAGAHGSTAEILDGPGATARFRSLAGLAIDPQKALLYMADFDGSEYLLRTVDLGDPSHTVNTLLVLDAAADPFRFLLVTDLTFDTNGELLVLADAGQRLVRVDLARQVARVWAGTSSTAGTQGLVDGPVATARFLESSLAVDATGAIWLVDASGLVLRRIGTDGVVRRMAGSRADRTQPRDGAGAAATFQDPGGLAADATGALWVADRSTLRRVGSDGVVSTLAGAFDTSGTPRFFNGRPAEARFGWADDVALDREGNAYIVESSNHVIRKFGRDGWVGTLAGQAASPGSRDGEGFVATFNNPRAVAVGPLGRIYVADGGNHTVREISPRGLVQTVAGTPGVTGHADSATGVGSTLDVPRFHSPQGIAVDAQGTVYVADSGNHTIRRITATGVVTTLAGSPGKAGATDGTGAEARFYHPGKLLIDGQGNLLVLDGGGGLGYACALVRKVTPAGVVTTVLGQPGRWGMAEGALPCSLYDVKGLALLPDGQLALSTGKAVFVTRDARL